MVISDFNKIELDYLRENCNFTGLELELFELRSSGFTLDYASEALHASRDHIGKISQRINRKIIKTLK